MNWTALIITLLLELALGFYWWRRAALKVHAKATLALRPETRHYTRTRQQAAKPKQLKVKAGWVRSNSG